MTHTKCRLSKPAVFFARAIDQRLPQNINRERKAVEVLFARAGLAMLDPFSDQPAGNLASVVRHDLAHLARAKAMLALMTIPKRNYIGVCCEIVYAYVLGIPIFVCVGSTDYGRRPFLQFHSKFIDRKLKDSIVHIREEFGLSKRR